MKQRKETQIKTKKRKETKKQKVDEQQNWSKSDATKETKTKAAPIDTKEKTTEALKTIGAAKKEVANVTASLVTLLPTPSMPATKPAPAKKSFVLKPVIKVVPRHLEQKKVQTPKPTMSLVDY